MLGNDDEVAVTACVGRSTSNGSDTSGKVWSAYLSEAERQDRALVENWMGDTEAILIFVRVLLSHLQRPKPLGHHVNRLMQTCTPEGYRSAAENIRRHRALICLDGARIWVNYASFSYCSPFVQRPMNSS